MKILITHAFSGTRRKTVELLKEKLQRQYQDADILVWAEVKPSTREALKKAEADLFVNFNLRGFEYGTLAGGIAYNLLDCKQIHILLDDRLPNEKQLAKQLSIAMFFYCADTRYCKELSEQYPKLPYLKEIEGWTQADTAADVERNADVLCRIVGEVAQICHLFNNIR